jgi:uncharacterized protein (TIGR01777 family)
VRVAVVGATGLIGGRVCRALAARGDEAIAVSRRGAAGIAGARDVRWDPAEGPPPAAALEGADAVVNLAGAPLDRRWTASWKREIRESRLTTTRLLVDALRGPDRPRVLVNASAVGYYGPTGDEEIDETSPPGSDFLAQICVAWEGEARRAAEAGVRVVTVRSGIVLAPEGGALPQLARPVRLFAGGPIGGGRQWMPWIHIDDEVALILLAAARDEVSGPMNATAPGPVRQRDFVAALGRVLGRPSSLPTPAVAVRLALGEMATLAVDGQRALPQAALRAGHRFAYTEVEPALRAALG